MVLVTLHMVIKTHPPNPNPNPNPHCLKEYINWKADYIHFVLQSICLLKNKWCSPFQKAGVDYTCSYNIVQAPG